jgi:hypothetical protein
MSIRKKDKERNLKSMAIEAFLKREEQATRLCGERSIPV